MNIHDIPLEHYSIGKVDSVKAVTNGLVHKTFDVKTDQGRYIFQKLHPALSTKAIAADFLAVTRHLKKKEFLTPEAVLTDTGEVMVSYDGSKWRMQTKITGRTLHVLKDRSMAREAGEIYARFHRVMDPINHTFKAKKLLHETEKIYNRFLGEIRRPKNTSYLDDVREEVNFLTEWLPKYFLPKNLPLRVIHGDPKISNILFDRNGRAKAIIDLDTCNRRPLLVELGDAFRSWCGNEEDDQKNKFCLKMFKSAWNGYADEMGEMMTLEERRYVPQAIGTITLELACRFLTDYFSDNYFGWDSGRYDTRKEHNLARCRGQLQEFKSYQIKIERIKEIVG